MTGSLEDTEKEKPQGRQLGEDQAEVGVIKPEAKDCRRTPEARKK